MLVVLIGLLGSCGGGKVALEVGDIERIENPEVEGEYLNALTTAELEQLAEKISDTYAKDFNPREYLVAASRGYSMDDVKNPDSDTDYGDSDAMGEYDHGYARRSCVCRRSTRSTHA